MTALRGGIYKTFSPERQPNFEFDGNIAKKILSIKHE